MSFNSSSASLFDMLSVSPFTDHVYHFRRLFEKVRIDSLLEFGVGLGTAYLLDHCRSVTSCSVILTDPSPEWLETKEWADQTLKLFSHHPNWTPVLKYASPQMQEANHLMKTKYADPTKYNIAYLWDLKFLCDELFQNSQFEMAFVDPGFFMRGDLVNELFDRVPLIAAHDTNQAPEIYGWNRVITPSHYVKLSFKEGQGITFWIHQDRSDIIEALATDQSLR